MSLHDIFSETPRQNGHESQSDLASNKLNAEVQQARAISQHAAGSSAEDTVSKWLPRVAIAAAEVAAGVAGALILGPEEGVVAGVLAGMWVAAPFIPVDAMAANFLEHEVKEIAKKV